MIPLDEIEQRDKRNSAVHEAGHAVVAFASGVIVKAWLERSETKDPGFEKTWVGHIQNVWGNLDGDAGNLSELLASLPNALMTSRKCPLKKSCNIGKVESSRPLHRTLNSCQPVGGKGKKLSKWHWES